jgi:hypothetical protein
MEEAFLNGFGEALEKIAKKKKKKKKGGKKWIAKAIKKPGALHEQLGVPKGKKIPKSKIKKAEKAKGKLGKRARLAATLSGLNKK